MTVPSLHDNLSYMQAPKDIRFPYMQHVLQRLPEEDCDKINGGSAQMCTDTFICVSNYYQVLISAIADRPLINYASCKSCIKKTR